MHNFVVAVTPEFYPSKLEVSTFCQVPMDEVQRDIATLEAEGPPIPNDVLRQTQVFEAVVQIDTEAFWASVAASINVYFDLIYIDFPVWVGPSGQRDGVIFLPTKDDVTAYTDLLWSALQGNSGFMSFLKAWWSDVGALPGCEPFIKIGPISWAEQQQVDHIALTGPTIHGIREAVAK